jgi:hypothetical protein
MSRFHAYLGWLAAGALLLGAAATPNYVLRYQPMINGLDVSPANPLPTAAASTPGTLTPAAPDVAVIATGGTAVNAFAATHVAKGGWLQNPAVATAPLCVNVSGAATITSAGGTSCLAAGQIYTIPPMVGAVSVNATDSGHAYSGTGYQ